MAITSPGFTPTAQGHYGLAETQTEKEYENQRKLALIAAQNAGSSATAAMHEAGATERAAMENDANMQRLGVEASSKDKQLAYEKQRLGLQDAQNQIDNKRQVAADARDAEKLGIDKQVKQQGLADDKTEQKRKDEEHQHKMGEQSLKDVARHLSTFQPGEDGSIDATPINKQIGIITGTDTSGYKSIVAKPTENGYTQFFGSKDGTAFEPLATASGKPAGFNNEFIKNVALHDSKADKNNDNYSPVYEEQYNPETMTSDKKFSGAFDKSTGKLVKNGLGDSVNNDINAVRTKNAEAILQDKNATPSQVAAAKVWLVSKTKPKMGLGPQAPVAGNYDKALANVSAARPGLGGGVADAEIQSDQDKRNAAMNAAEQDAGFN